jgi:hypothetical protein
MLLVVGTVGGFLLLFGGFVFAQNLFEGLDQKDSQIQALQSDVSQSETRLLVLAKRSAKLRHWQAISLPPDRRIAQSRYRTFLQDLFERHFPNREGEPKKWQIAPLSGSALSGRTSANFSQPIPIQAGLTGVTLNQLMGFLLEFHAADVPHEIRQIDITPVGSGSDTKLDVTLRIEAQALPTAPDRDILPVVADTQRLAAELVAVLQPGVLPSLRGLAHLSPLAMYGSHKLAAAYHHGRDYNELAAKNIFIGLAPGTVSLGAADRDVLKFTQLTAIQANFITTEAWVRNRRTNDYARLRTEIPFNTFKISDTKGLTVLTGRVLAIEPREVETILEIGGETRRCMVHVGEFFDQAWKDGKKLNEAEIKALDPNLSSAADNR